MKIVELKIEDGLLSGVDAIAFVEEPAIEMDFQYFSKQLFEDTFNDYPQKARENAKRGIELNEENDNKCATQVGKVRAQQLAKGENVSLDTIRRMRAFLIRQRDNYELARDRKDYNACGYISYLLWGGEEALPWAEKKLRQAGEELSADVSALPNYVNEVDGEIEPKIEFANEKEKTIYETYLFEKFLESKLSAIGYVNDIPYYSTIEEARAQSPKYGCSADSWHEYRVGAKTYYMPCGSHSEMFNDEWVNELTEDIEEAVYNALLNVGKTDDELIDEGYDFEKAIAIDAKDEFVAEAFVASVSEIKRASDENKASNDDFGSWKVLYRYMRYNKKEEYTNNSRPFCVNVIKANKWFRKEDINKLTLAGANEGFGLQGQRFYDIFTYKGGKNCQHFWQAFMVPRKEKASERERPSAVLNRIVDATSLNPDTLDYLVAEGRLKFSQEVMDEKQLVATPIMVPNKLIPRRDENGDKYYVYFTEETIKEIAYKFAESKNIDKINHEHDMESMVDNVYLAESWIVEEPANDKSNIYGYKLPKGAWFGLFKVNNKDYWKDYIKTGKVKGVSVEGYFVNKLSKLQ